jgi:hypothetical protein
MNVKNEVGVSYIPERLGTVRGDAGNRGAALMPALCSMSAVEYQTIVGAVL